MIQSNIIRNKAQFASYLGLVKDKYQHFAAFDYFFDDIKKAVDYTCESAFQNGVQFLYIENQKLLAHVVLYSDSRFKANEAFFGFFECVNDPKVFENLWLTLLSVAKKQGITKLNGPVNGSIWHAYRFSVPLSSGYEPFTSDVLSEPFYYTWFKALNPDEELGYYSGKRNKTQTLIELTQPAFESLQKQGLQINKLRKISRQNLDDFLELSIKTFSKSWGYVALNHDEFLQLYSRQKLDRFVSEVYQVEWKEQSIGFCTLIKEHRHWILKTMAIHPDYQGMGVGNALVHKIHVDALKHKVPEIIYALIRDTNKIRFFPKDDAHELCRYACFTYSI